MADNMNYFSDIMTNLNKWLRMAGSQGVKPSEYTLRLARTGFRTPEEERQYRQYFSSQLKSIGYKYGMGAEGLMRTLMQSIASAGAGQLKIGLGNIPYEIALSKGREVGERISLSREEIERAKEGGLKTLQNLMEQNYKIAENLYQIKRSQIENKYKMLIEQALTEGEHDKAREYMNILNELLKRIDNDWISGNFGPNKEYSWETSEVTIPPPTSTQIKTVTNESGTSNTGITGTGGTAKNDLFIKLPYF